MSSSLSRYLGACQQHIEELTHSLSDNDLATLREDLTQLGKKGWSKWQHANQDEIEDFLQATPSERNRRKAWQDQSLRLRLSYGAILYAKESDIVLSVLHQSTWLDCDSVADYRDMTASAAGLLYQMIDQYIALNAEEFPDLDFPRRLNYF